MLLPFAMGLCVSGTAAPERPGSALGEVALVSLVHTAAMLASGLGIAWLVYRYLGLRLLNRVWFDLEAVWGAGLMMAGAASIAMVALR
jgi:hypothetical protein